jgi:DHA2 family lincomycin resistance protein-like MFS transporter
VLPFYLQLVLGLTTLQIGLVMLPGGLIMGLLGPVVGRLYDRFGAPVLLVPGSTLISTAFWLFSSVGVNTPFWVVLIAHMVMSIGLAFVFTPLFTAGLGSVRPKLYSHGSATLGTIQQVAGAAGTAIFVSVLASRESSLLNAGASEVAATTGGVQMAFLFGAMISLVGIVLAFFIRTPALDPDAPPLRVGH